ncbi:MAG: hypothetical protein J1E85_03345 [Ruminococcus sp.]|nr:hypothetical protein [Ruminococcus sp.]
MKKKLLSIILTAILAAFSTAMFTGCGNENTATSDEAVRTSASVDEITYDNTSETVPTLSDTEQAIVDEGLKVDDKGNITDSKGNKVEVKDDGTVEVKTKSGETVKVKADDVKTANVNNQKIENTVNSSSNSSSAAKSNSNSSSSATKSNSSSSKSNSSQNTNNSASSSSVQNDKKPTNNSSSTSKPNNNSQSSTTDPHAGKTWHEAEYEYINHPAETKKVWVVDEESYTYEEDIYEEHTICKGCGAFLDEMLKDERLSHSEAHLLAGENSGWYRTTIKVGTKTITVPEEGHWETKIVKDAWTEKVLVREAGWY